MKRSYTAESVTEGHPDKLCDRIAYRILDDCLQHDALSRVACEVLAAKGKILVAGEITSQHEPYLPELVREVIKATGYGPEGIEIEVEIHPQSPDIASGVDRPLEVRSGAAKAAPALQFGAGDQGVMTGYACKETPEFLPLPVALAHRLTAQLTLARKGGQIHGLRPDGKAQVTVEYEDDAPVRLEAVVLSAQHDALTDVERLRFELSDKVLFPALKALPPDEDTRILLNPSGRFVQGGIEADTGLTGRKLAADAYGPLVPLGGGALSGKDPT